MSHPIFRAPALAGLALLVCLVPAITHVGPARADELDPATNMPAHEVQLGNAPAVSATCIEIKFVTDEIQKTASDLLVCHGGKRGDATWKAVADAAGPMGAAGRAYFASIGEAGPDGPCKVPQADTNAVAAAQRERAKLEAALTAAKSALDEAQKANLKLDEVNAKADDVTKKKAALDEVKAKDTSAKKKIVADATEAVRKTRALLNAAMVAASPEADFDEVMKSPDRTKACIALRGELLALYGDKRSQKEKEDKKDETDARANARATDVLRKSSALSTAMSGGNGILETVGTPDHVVFSVMSALGADSKNVGTQVVTQLNLSTLFEHDDARRLELPAFARNVFLRAAVPLTATENKPQAGPDDGKASGDSSTRFSLVLGSSLYDEADPRLKTANDCYAAVYGYRSAAFREEDAATVKEQRKGLMDRCNRDVARKHRLAWRLGAGFITRKEKTEAELLAAALVYAPTSALFFNAIYQNIRVPDPRHTFGGGFSLAMNVGGPESGVDAWGRIGLDFTLLGIYQPGKPADKQFDWEARVTPTVRGRFLGNQFISLGLGPRILGSGKNVGVLATLGLTADADNLVNGLLTPAAPPDPPATK